MSAKLRLSNFGHKQNSDILIYHSRNPAIYHSKFKQDCHHHWQSPPSHSIDIDATGSTNKMERPAALPDMEKWPDTDASDATIKSGDDSPPPKSGSRHSFLPLSLEPSTSLFHYSYVYILCTQNNILWIFGICSISCTLVVTRCDLFYLC